MLHFRNKIKNLIIQNIKEKFGEKRWINVDNSEILDYENTQLLLIGARKRNVEEELGIEIDEERTKLVQTYLKNSR
jgi:hypothetical protein